MKSLLAGGVDAAVEAAEDGFDLLERLFGSTHGCLHAGLAVRSRGAESVRRGPEASQDASTAGGASFSVPGEQLVDGGQVVPVVSVGVSRGAVAGGKRVG